jgi:hypothetical protein
MDLRLTPEQEDARDRARAVAARALAPRAGEHDQRALFPAPQIRALAEEGFLTMLAPRSAGGQGLGAVAYALAVTEVARACASTSVTMAVTNMVADAISAFGSEAQQQAHVPRLGRAEHLAGSFCLSEPGAGSDAASLQTVAAKRGDRYVLNGTKMWITSGDVAGVLLVMAKTDVAAGARGISAFLVDPEAAGVALGKKEEKMGLRASSTVAITFEDVEVPETARLGPEGIGFKIAMRALDGGRIGIGSQALGIAAAALEQVKAALREEDALRSATAEARLAALHTRVEAARMLILRAATLKDAGRPDFTREASMAKLFATETANQVCAEAIELVGPDGYGAGAPLERLFRDVRVTTIYEGTSEIQRLVIARKVLAA